MTTTNYFAVPPTVSHSLSVGWSKMKEQFLPLLLIVFICALLQGPVNLTFKNGDFNFLMLLFLPVALAYGFLFWPVIDWGADLLFLKAVRNQKVEVAELFDGFRTKFVKIVLAYLLVFALVMVGFFLLIIPGIIIACRLAFVSYLVMDKDMDAIAAVEESWRMTRGYGWTIFFLGVISFFLIIAGLLVMIVGVLVSAMWISASFAALYQSVLVFRQSNETLPILGVNEVPDEPVVKP